MAIRGEANIESVIRNRRLRLGARAGAGPAIPQDAAVGTTPQIAPLVLARPPVREVIPFYTPPEEGEGYSAPNEAETAGA